MFLIRAAGLIQVAFLPGWLVLAAAGIDRSRRLQTLVRAFAASLIVNYVVALVLTAVGLYRPVVLWVVFALECAWFVNLQWGRRIAWEGLRDGAKDLGR